MATDERAPAPYDVIDVERWIPEPAKDPERTPFERDRARVLHSAALRRLAAKTQVHEPGADDFVRTRLTHSLEVAQVGRELGKTLGCDPDLVETACLAHDLGHPPFGHNGERVLDEAAAPCGGFEGNAQTLRILTRLDAKRTAPDGRSVGLNLTRATLDAATKYPWPRGGMPGTRKFGVYGADTDVFGWLRAAAPEARPCVEAQVMDLADDIAYSVHDVEDGVQAGRIPLAAVTSPAEVGAVTRRARELYAPDAADAELTAALDRLTALSFWPRSYDGTRSSLAALKNATSALIGRFCSSAQDATRAAYGDSPLVRYRAEVVVPHETHLEIAMLKAVAAHFVMFTDDRAETLSTERTLLAELVEAVASGAPQTLLPALREDWRVAATETDRLRVVVDHVASLTDTSALAQHAAICG